MIIVPEVLLLSESLTQPLTHARIGWHTYTSGLDALAVTVSGETADGPRDAPLQPETVQFWEPPSLPATWDLDFGALRDLDYVGLVANLGSVGCAVEARISEDVADYNDYLSLSGVDANYASTPDSVANSITGDLHLELELAIDNADLPDFSLDFMGDFPASVTKITDDGTFTRAGDTATRINQSGVPEMVLANTPRQDYSTVTRAVLGYFDEAASVNLCLQSENFSASWTATGTPTRSAAAKSCGIVDLDLIGDDNGAGFEGYFQAVTFSASAVRAISAYVSQGTSTSSIIKIRDTSIGADRVQAVITWSGGAPVVTMTAGTHDGTDVLPGDVFRIRLLTTSGLVHTNTNQIQVWPAETSAFAGTLTGDIYIGGVQAENADKCSSYIPTTTGTVTRNQDALTLTDLTAMAFNAVEGTAIVDYQVNSMTGSTRVPFSINDATANNQINPIQVSGAGTDDSAVVSTGGVTQAAVSSGAISPSTPIKKAMVYKSNDVNAARNGVLGSADTSVALPAVSRATFGRRGDSGAHQYGWLRHVFYYATRRLNATLQDFSRATYRVLASKWAETSNQRSWALCLKENCALVLFVSTDGTAAGIREYHSAPLTFVEGVRFRIRVKLDIISGSDSVCTFQTSDDDGATWDTLGSAITQASVSAIFNSTAPVEVGAFNGGTAEFQGKVFQFWLHATLADGPVIHFDAAEGETGDTSITSEDTGEVWTIHSTGPATALKIKRFSLPVAPGDDAPIMLLDEARNARRLRLRFTGTTPPRLAVVYAGEVLAMEREVDGNGFAPLTLSRETELSQPLSRGGQFLSQSFKRFGVKGGAGFRHLDPDWYREYFDPFVRHARALPYFFAWWPEAYPEEVGFVWTDRDIAPSYMGVREWMQVNWNMHGIGCE